MKPQDRPKLRVVRKCAKSSSKPNGKQSIAKTTTVVSQKPGSSKSIFNSIDSDDSCQMIVDQKFENPSSSTNSETVSFEPSYLHDEFYRVWKKNAEYLYDMLIAHTTEWPSLTVEWLPDVVRPPHRDYTIHRLLLGTQASGRNQNHLIIARVHLPYFDLSKLTSKTSHATKTGYGAFGVITAKVENYVKINHNGHVNRARHMPQNSFIIASKSSNNDVYIFDYSQHQSDPTPNTDSNPDARLVGHTDEGYGLSWNYTQRGVVLSASDDSLVCLWDINGNQKKGRTIPAKSKFHGHVGPVNDVQWHCFHEQMFGSVGDDKKLILWDVRSQQPHSIKTVTAHSAAINCLAFNPYSEFVMLTGSADKTAALWDLRNLKIKLHSFESHRDEIYQIQWAPHCETVFATCSPDRRLFVWDISKIGQEQSEDEAAEGPPELLFIHGGHPSKVTDLSWSQSEPWMMASVSDNNILQIWKMIHTSYENGTK